MQETVSGEKEGVKEPVRAVIIRDEHADGGSKKVEGKARKYPIET